MLRLLEEGHRRKQLTM